MSIAEREIRSRPEEETRKILEEIHGEALEKRIIALARIGGTSIEGTTELPERYAVNRLALTKSDLESRQYLAESMQEAGMSTITHPLGVLGRYEGIDPTLPAVLVMSHTDSVPNGGQYDGTVGVISAIEIVRLFQQHNLRFPHPIIVAAVTGEESARFNMALLGSRGLFHGFTDKELVASRPGDITLGQALEDAGFDPKELKRPTFAAKDIKAAIELHVAQDDSLEDGIAVVEAIAAPERFQAIIGKEKLVAENQIYSHLTTVHLRIHGQAGHSGTTPMNRRQDGFLVVADIIREFASQNKNVGIDDIQIIGEAMNKIPGLVDCSLRIPQNLKNKLETYIGEKNITLEQSGFGRNAIAKISAPTPNKESAHYSPQALLPRQQAAAEAIHIIKDVCHAYGEQHIVGTVGTYRVEEGFVKLGVDIRGIDLALRNRVVQEIQQRLRTALQEKNLPEIDFGNALAGSGEPVRMDAHLVATAKELADKYGITPNCITSSAAGHDIQNTARPNANIPSVLFFCPSRNDGIAHTPDEYSTPKDLEDGAKALCALVMHLAA